jgi:ribonucleoside-diphosphate reductase alpha chain
VYRDGSRDNQVLSTGKTADAAAARNVTLSEAKGLAREERERIGELVGTLAEKDAELEALKKQLYEVEAENLQRRQKRSRPNKLRGATFRKETPLGVAFISINEDEKGQPFEVFVTLGKAGGAAMADAEAMGRLMSLALRSGIPMTSIIRQMRGISSDRAVGLGPNKVLSVPDAIGIALDEWWRDKVQGVQQEVFTTSEFRAPGAPSADEPPSPKAVPVMVRPMGNQGERAEAQRDDTGESFMGTCPDCSSQLEYAEGCVKCHVCGFSECG